MFVFLSVVMFLTAAVALIWGAVLAIRAAVDKRKGLDHKPRLKRCYVACGTFGAAFVLFVVFAGLSPPPAGSSANALPAARPQIAAKQMQTATASPAQTATAEPTSPPTPEQTDSPEQEKFRSDWMDIMERTASAAKSEEAGEKAIRNGDVITGSGDLKNCQDAASGIKDDATDMLGDDNSDSGTNLWGAVAKIGDGLGNGCKSMRAFLDTQTPSDAADAKDDFKDMADAIPEAELRAIAKYKEMGGDVNSLLDFKSAMQEAR